MPEGVVVVVEAVVVVGAVKKPRVAGYLGRRVTMDGRGI